MKVSKGTVARTVVLVLALLNQVLAVMGKSPLDIDEDTIYQLATLIATVGTSVWAWWKNNSFTKAAINADAVKDALKVTGDDSEEA